MAQILIPVGPIPEMDVSSSPTGIWASGFCVGLNHTHRVLVTLGLPGIQHSDTTYCSRCKLKFWIYKVSKTLATTIVDLVKNGTEAILLWDPRFIVQLEVNQNLQLEEKPVRWSASLCEDTERSRSVLQARDVDQTLNAGSTATKLLLTNRYGNWYLISLA